MQYFLPVSILFAVLNSAFAKNVKKDFEKMMTSCSPIYAHEHDPLRLVNTMLGGFDMLLYKNCGILCAFVNEDIIQRISKHNSLDAVNLGNRARSMISTTIAVQALKVQEPLACARTHLTEPKQKTSVDRTMSGAKNTAANITRAKNLFRV